MPKSIWRLPAAFVTNKAFVEKATECLSAKYIEKYKPTKQLKTSASFIMWLMYIERFTKDVGVGIIYAYKKLNINSLSVILMQVIYGNMAMNKVKGLIIRTDRQNNLHKTTKKILTLSFRSDSNIFSVER